MRTCLPGRRSFSEEDPDEDVIEYGEDGGHGFIQIYCTGIVDDTDRNHDYEQRRSRQYRVAECAWALVNQLVGSKHQLVPAFLFASKTFVQVLSSASDRAGARLRFR
jgi:hypothetical protein